MTKSEQRQRLDIFFQDRQELAKGTINEMMKFELTELMDDSVILKFPVEQWQLNPMGYMHGGMIATAADIAMGCASYVFSSANHTPTITMNIQYLKSIAADIPIYIKASVLHAGSRITQIHAEVIQDQKVCADASGSYMINTHD